jgi:hypothetical protein
MRRHLPIAALLALLLAFAACTDTPKPPATATPWTVYFEVYDASGKKVPNAKLEVDVASNKPHVQAAANFEGNADVQVPAGLTRSHLWANAEGFEALSMHLDLTDGAHVQVHLQPLHVTLPAIRADGRVFRLPDGSLWRYQGLSAFTLLQRYIDGEAKAPGQGKAYVVDFARQAKGLGVNVLRVFARLQWAPLNPATVPHFFEHLDAVIQLLEDEGLRVELVALADCATAGHNKVAPAFVLTRAQQQAFLDQVAAVAAKHTSTFVEWGNEYPYNGWSPDLFATRRPFAVLQSRGSSGMQGDPAAPPLDYSGYHAGRDSEWPRKMGKQACEYGYGCGGAKPTVGVFGVPVIDDEPFKFVDGNATPTQAYAGFANSALQAPGATIHSQSLLTATWPKGKELEAVQAAAQAWRDMPLDAPLGAYTRGPFADCPLEHIDLAKDPQHGSLRTFCRLFSDRAYCTAPGAGPRWKARAKPGWRITRQTGPNGLVVFLAKG